MSDIPSILGIDRFNSPVETWARIVHDIHPIEKEWLETAGEWGKESEEGTAKMLLRELGRQEHLAKPPSRHPPGRKWQRYSLDFVTGVQFDQDGNNDRWVGWPNEEQSIIECKLREWLSWKAQGWGDMNGTGDIPLSIEAQVQGQLEAVRYDRDFWTGTDIPELDQLFVAVRVGAFDLRWYEVARDEELGGMLVDRCERFWREHVETGIAPPIDGSASSLRYLATIHPEAKGEIREAEGREIALAAQYRELKDSISTLGRAQDLIKNQLIEAIGADLGIKGPGWRIAYRNEKGRVSLGKALEEICDEHGVSKDDKLALRERHRGKPTRKFDPRFGS